ncbi:hypothetical protein [Deminuibacter soli]|nr:hypothetical protein [Deminuibacter soli]
MNITVILTTLIIQSCSLFEKDERLLTEHTTSNGQKIEIYYVGLGATTNDVIQVRKSGLKKPVWISDKYNCLKASDLINDISLRLVLTDTGFNNYTNKADTLLVDVR